MSDKKDLLILLKDKSPRTAVDLAAALDVTSRTIYRWVEKLSEEGYPVYSTAGRSGGIYLGDSDGVVLEKSSAKPKSKAKPKTEKASNSETESKSENKTESKT